ncbi:MAG: nuclease A inhibitor family protein [Hymenobacteraceae bacterium]|nr:nuclease A inhibitor family protein [Hymenobacteraceae bacterium]
MNKEQLEQELNQATDGLLMKSDIEAPFDFFYREMDEEQFSPELVAEWAGKPSGMTVETKSLDEFFRETKGVVSDTRGKTKGGDEGLQQIKDALSKLVQDVKVYCINQIGTEAFILGRTEDGNYAGLRTMVIEDESSVDNGNA